MRAVRAVTLLACAALTLSGRAAAAADGDVILEVALDGPVKLGDDVVLKVTVTNRSLASVDVPAFRLARDAVSVQVAWGAAAAPAHATVTRLWGEWHEEGGALAFTERTTPLRPVAAGASVRGTVTFAAVVAGDLTLTTQLGADGAARLVAKPLVVEVLPKSGPPKRLVAEVETSGGTFTCELDGAGAFNAVSHFWRLARDGFYDGLTVHRIERGLLFQGGCPRGDGSGGPGWYLPAEGDGRIPTRGAFGFARAAHPDSAGSQFVVVADKEGRAADALRGHGPGGPEWTPLGRLLDAQSQDAADAIASQAADPRTGRPAAPVLIRAVRPLVR